MSTPMYAVRIKKVNRYHYRGKLYNRLDEQRQVISHIVDRVLRDHLVGSGYFEDVRATEPEPIEPVAVPEPEPVALAEEDLTESPEVPGESAPVTDMSNASINGPRTYGAPGKGTVKEV